MIRMPVVLVLLVAVLAVPAIKADTVTFKDLTESPTVDISGTRSSGSCVGEICTVQILEPAGASNPDSTWFSRIGDPGGVTISDKVDIEPSGCQVGTTIVLCMDVTFTSDDETPGGLGLCGICGVIENGQIQQDGTITWVDANSNPVATDTINFESDVEAPVVTPEPSTLLLLGTGLGAAYLRKRPSRALRSFRFSRS